MRHPRQAPDLAERDGWHATLVEEAGGHVDQGVTGTRGHRTMLVVVDAVNLTG
ncbi:hypothetical protein GCM10022225_56630 [Plantactinospora mayteni]|uniref:Uncharacterized protein n=1 Tax=Plantactinospora mayteni TaxID=566021 RepID=A0ABQ4EUG2_9ACTN|nr:hypothetical protein Pma05_48730 [Plantactinospora mayteni]